MANLQWIDDVLNKKNTSHSVDEAGTMRNNRVDYLMNSIRGWRDFDFEVVSVSYFK